MHDIRTFIDWLSYHPTSDLGRFVRQLWILAKETGKGFGWPYLFIAALPFGLLRRTGGCARRWLLGLAATFICVGPLMVGLLNPAEDRASVDVASLSRDDLCALGKWAHGEGGQCHAGQPGFVALLARHAEFHRAAGEVGTRVNQRRYRGAEEALTPGAPFARCTSEVVAPGDPLRISPAGPP